MYRIRKEFKFEGAHRLTSSYSERCQHIHGHSYRVEVFMTAAKLNNDGMVLDFKELKDIGIAKVIDEFDHALVLNVEDTSAEAEVCRVDKSRRVIDFPYNPTAENMARFFYHQIESLMKEAHIQVKLEKVRVWETASAWAEFGENV